MIHAVVIPKVSDKSNTPIIRDSVVVKYLKRTFCKRCVHRPPLSPKLTKISDAIGKIRNIDTIIIAKFQILSRM
jgi:hypothetical protein